MEASELRNDAMINASRLKIMQNIKDLKFSTSLLSKRGTVVLNSLQYMHFPHNSGDFFEFGRIPLFLLAHLKNHCT